MSDEVKGQVYQIKILELGMDNQNTFFRQVKKTVNAETMIIFCQV